MPSATIHLVRHGVTDHNKERRIQGQLDTPLSDEGRLQAKETAQKLMGLPIEKLYSSDLSRAIETAKIISEIINVKIEPYRPDLREIDFGRWQGHTMIEIAELFPDEHAAWMVDRTYTAPYDGESYYDFAQRGFKAVKALAAIHPGQTAVAVSHGALIRVVYCMVNGFDIRDRDVPVPGNASVTTVEL